MNKESLDKIIVLRDQILKSRKTMVLTGAGISTDSGIPDFRSPGQGLWETMDPMEFLTNKVMVEETEEFYNKLYKAFKPRDYHPNRGHSVLAELESRGLVDGIITQNIDGLHQEAGSKKVYEVHGNINNAYCQKCGQGASLEDIRSKIDMGELPPRCENCGGVLRTSVVLFGDSLPDVFDYARDQVLSSDLLLVIGSSLSVAPVNILADLAKNLIIINREDTGKDYLADLFIREDISSSLGKLLDLI